MLEVVEVKYLKEYKIWIKFNNEKSGCIDLKNHLWGEVFEPLKDLSNFQRFQLAPELGTISWYNEADFAPEFLLDNLDESFKQHENILT